MKRSGGPTISTQGASSNIDERMGRMERQLELLNERIVGIVDALQMKKMEVTADMEK